MVDPLPPVRQWTNISLTVCYDPVFEDCVLDHTRTHLSGISDQLSVDFLKNSNCQKGSI